MSRSTVTTRLLNEAELALRTRHIDLLNLGPKFITTAIDESKIPCRIEAIYIYDRPAVCDKCGRNDRTKPLRIKWSAPIKDLYHGHPTELRIKRWQFKCHHSDCKREFYPKIPEIAEKRKMTVRLKDHIIERVARRWIIDHIVTDVGGSRSTIREVFMSEFRRLEAEHDVILPVWLGIDEINLEGQLYMILTDLKNHRLVAILKGKGKTRLANYLQRASISNRLAVKRVGIDNDDTYRLTCALLLPNCTIVSDHFHFAQIIQNCFKSLLHKFKEDIMSKGIAECHSRIAQLATKDPAELKRLARTIEKEILGKCRAEAKYLNQMKPKLLKTNPSKVELDAVEKFLSRYPLLKRAHLLKTELIELWNRKLTVAVASKLYKRWKQSIPRELKQSFKPVLTLMSYFGRENFAFFIERVTNAYTEAMNGRIRNYYYLRSGCKDDLWRAVFLYPEYLKANLYKHKNKPNHKQLFLLNVIDEMNEEESRSMRDAGIRHRKLKKQSAPARRQKKLRKAHQATPFLPFGRLSSQNSSHS